MPSQSVSEKKEVPTAQGVGGPCCLMTLPRPLPSLLRALGLSSWVAHSRDLRRRTGHCRGKWWFGNASGKNVALGFGSKFGRMGDTHSDAEFRWIDEKEPTETFGMGYI